MVVILINSTFKIIWSKFARRHSLYLLTIFGLKSFSLVEQNGGATIYFVIIIAHHSNRGVLESIPLLLGRVVTSGTILTFFIICMGLNLWVWLIVFNPCRRKQFFIWLFNNENGWYLLYGEPKISNHFTFAFLTIYVLHLSKVLWNSVKPQYPILHVITTLTIYSGFY